MVKGSTKLSVYLRSKALQMKNIFFFVILFSSFYSNCYSQNWLWARCAVSSGNTGQCFDKGNSVSADVNGNVFVSGTFCSPTIAFGSVTLTNSSSTGLYNDIFIVKYDATGNVLWAKSAGGVGPDVRQSVSADINGNVIITGWFSGPSITFGSTTLTNNGGDDIFITKYDGNGNVVWAKNVGGTSSVDSYSVFADAGGNVFITGVFYYSNLTFGSITLINSGSGDIFIAKYDSSGNVLWAKNAGGTGDDEGRSISTDPGGNVFVTGYFTSPTITFDSITLTNVAAYTPDVFIVKYDANGNVLWAKNAGGTPSQYGGAGCSLSADASGSVFVTGYFTSPTITFDSITLTNAESSGHYSDVFIAKYDASGNVLWAKRAGGTNTDAGYSLSADADGNVFVIGNFSSSSIAFDFDTLLFPAGSSYPMFIVKYDANGNVLCTSTLASDGVNGVSVDSFDNAYIVGDVWIPPFIVGPDTLTLMAGGNIFVAKFECGNNISVAVNKLSLESNLSIYPNPTSGSFTLDFNKRSIGTKIYVYNLLGNCLSQTIH